MMESISNTHNIKPHTTSPISRKNTHTGDARTAGSMPVWKGRTDAKPSTAMQESVASSYRAPNTFQNTNIEIKTQSPPEEKFGFADLVDMVNPLQHIPLVNLAYRELTGDQIKPIGMIIGGSLFGGPIGAASGLVNTVIQAETGTDALGNATAFVRGEQRFKNATNLNMQANGSAYDDLPVSLLAFAQTPMPEIFEDEGKAPDNMNAAHHKHYETTKIASGRTAGTIAIYS